MMKASTPDELPQHSKSTGIVIVNYGAALQAENDYGVYSGDGYKCIVTFYN